MRQVECKGRAFPFDAPEVNLSAEETSDFTTDREAESGPPELSTRCSIGLLERLEDDPLLILRNPDTGVGDRKGDHTLGLFQRHRVERRLLLSIADCQRDPPLLREFEGVCQKVLQNLEQPLGIGLHRCRK